jgi:hypothetical protein
VTVCIVVAMKRALVLVMAIGALALPASANALTQCHPPTWLAVEATEPEGPTPYGFHIFSLREAHTNCRLANQVLANWAAAEQQTHEQPAMVVAGGVYRAHPFYVAEYWWRVHYASIELRSGERVEALTFTHGRWRVWAREEWERQ